MTHKNVSLSVSVQRAFAVVIAAMTMLGAVAVLAAATPASAPIADAAMRGDLARVRKLIAQGERVSSPQGDGMTALHWAADRGDSAMTEVLIHARADVRAVTRIGGYTPLHIASRSGQRGGGHCAAQSGE